MNLKPGWLTRQLEQVAAEVATWPAWMRRKPTTLSDRELELLATLVNDHHQIAVLLGTKATVQEIAEGIAGRLSFPVTEGDIEAVVNWKPKCP